MDEKVEFKLPYFNDIYKMAWIAQPFAVVANLFLSVFYLVVIVAFWIAYAVVACAVFVLLLPFILFSEVFGWIRGWFRYRNR